AKISDTTEMTQVYCPYVPETGAFALDGFILTGNSNPYQRQLKTDMPSGMRGAIKSIRTNNGKQVWAWGGDWSGNKDAMHWYICCTPRDLAYGINPASVQG